MRILLGTGEPGLARIFLRVQRRVPGAQQTACEARFAARQGVTTAAIHRFKDARFRAAAAAAGEQVGCSSLGPVDDRARSKAIDSMPSAGADPEEILPASTGESRGHRGRRDE